MKVIDELLLEWSYQCPDGIVDINNPEKVKILSRILNEIDSKQELVDLIKASDLSPEQIDKLKKYVSKKTTRSNVNVELENLLASKGLKRVGPLVIYLANKFDVEDILLEYLKTNKKSSIGENGNLFTEFSSESGLPEEFIKENLIAALGSKIQCSFTKDTTPRIYLSNEKTKTDENITQ